MASKILTTSFIAPQTMAKTAYRLITTAPPKKEPEWEVEFEKEVPYNIIKIPFKDHIEEMKKRQPLPTLSKIPDLPEELTVLEFLPNSNVQRRPETVICSHGWGGRGLNFYKFIPKLQEKDFPQHGRTDGPEAGAHCFAHGINLVIRYVDGPVYLITHSLGNVGFWGSYSFSSQKEKDAIKRYVGIGIPNDYEDILFAFENTIGLSRRCHPYFLDIHASCFGDEFCRNQIFGKVINELNIPTLLIHDKNDKELDFEKAKETASHLSKKQYKVKSSGEVKPTFYESEGLGHRRIIRDDDIIDRVVEFLSEDIEF
ncbi:alpha/beta-hydrolase [Neocallimastix lanati (nom. inval.)]|nr:alpha/beta-hydrolase [Neocallimastix sp. JGI-2020a]